MFLSAIYLKFIFQTLVQINELYVKVIHDVCYDAILFLDIKLILIVYLISLIERIFNLIDKQIYIWILFLICCGNITKILKNNE